MSVTLNDPLHVHRCLRYTTFRVLALPQYWYIPNITTRRRLED